MSTFFSLKTGSISSKSATKIIKNNLDDITSSILMDLVKKLINLSLNEINLESIKTLIVIIQYCYDKLVNGNCQKECRKEFIRAPWIIFYIDKLIGTKKKFDLVRRYIYSIVVNKALNKSHTIISIEGENFLIKNGSPIIVHKEYKKIETCSDTLHVKIDMIKDGGYLKLFGFDKKDIERFGMKFALTFC